MTLKHSRLQYTIDSFPIPLNKGTNFVRHHASSLLLLVSHIHEKRNFYPLAEEIFFPLVNWSAEEAI